MNTIWRSLRVSLGLLAISANLSLAYGDEAESGVSNAQAEIYICPNASRAFRLVEFWDQWETARSKVAGIKLYIDFFQRHPHEDLARLAKLIGDAGLEVVVECGGTLNHDWGDRAGEKSAEVEMEKIKRWYQAGGKVDYLDIDGPIRRLFGREGWGTYPERRFTSAERAAEELMDYLDVASVMYPDMQYFLLTNFPNWGYRGGVSYHGRGPKQQDWGDYDEVLRVVLEVAEERGHRFEALTVDNPYSYGAGDYPSLSWVEPEKKVDWFKRIQELETFVRSKGMRFNLIVNTDIHGEGSDARYARETLAMVDRYKAVGGDPDRLMVQSWHSHPKQIVPEDAEHSLTWLTLEVAKRSEASE